MFDSMLDSRNPVCQRLFCSVANGLPAPAPFIFLISTASAAAAAAQSCNVALSSRSSRDLVRDLGYEGKAEEREGERKVGELALVASLDRWIGEGGEGGRRRGRRKRRRDFNALTLLFWW